MSGPSADAGRLADRVVVVTGGGSGIGAAIARACAAHGARVAVADRDADAARAVAGDVGAAALPVVADVTDRASVARGLDLVVETFGRLDVVFNNAGVNTPMRFLDVTEENFRRVLEVNALGVLIGTQEAARRFPARGPGGRAVRGKVVNTASIAGRTGFPDFAPYSASKAAVISLTQSAARALAADGVTVNAFSPGVVATPLWRQLDADLTAIGAADAGFDSMAGDILLGRPAEPADIAPTAVYLASADSDYMTGQVVAIDGGMVLV
ncbi:glucose 1-dehydrogenase [Modestobacter sp. SSW1-42]|uniref:glucose 1-dehydrogenase n=1 Tax=Modestobacter sp. SSW1-42 TaxID=596372 RepID=UPI0039877ED9